MTTTNEKLRQEFNEWFNVEFKFRGSLVLDDVADWWLTKIEAHNSQLKENIQKLQDKSDGIGDYSAGHVRAYDKVLALLK